MKNFPTFKPRPILSEFWISFTLVFFSFYSYLSSLNHPGNRLELAWSGLDAPALALMIGFCALPFFWAGLMGPRLIKEERSRARLAILFIFLLLWPVLDKAAPFQYFLGEKSASPFWLKKADIALKLAALGGLAWGLLKKAPSFLKGVRLVLLIFSPTVLVFFGRAVFYPTVHTQAGTPAALSKADEKKHGPILFLMFDEWSYGRTFSGGNPDPIFQNLSALCAQSHVYHDARSPGATTNESVPQYLGTPSLQKSAAGKPMMTVQNSLFETAKESGWTSAAIGAYLPYAEWFSGETDFSFHAPNYRPPSAGFLELFQSHLSLGQIASLGYWLPAFSGKVYEAGVRNAQEKRVSDMSALFDQALQSASAGVFVYLHAPLPHDPFLYPVKNSDTERGQILSYVGNIKAADAWVGAIKKRLVEKGQWDNALVMLTSDHGWKTDPALGLADSPGAVHELLTHVPLVIKKPGQKSRVDHGEAFQVVDAIQGLREALRGN